MKVRILNVQVSIHIESITNMLVSIMPGVRKEVKCLTDHRTKHFCSMINFYFRTLEDSLALTKIV